MALIECPECGKRVSDKAVACPECGFPISQYVEEKKQEQEEQAYLIDVEKRKFEYTKEQICHAFGKDFIFNTNQIICKGVISKLGIKLMEALNSIEDFLQRDFDEYPSDCSNNINRFHDIWFKIYYKEVASLLVDEALLIYRDELEDELEDEEEFRDEIISIVSVSFDEIVLPVFEDNRSQLELDLMNVNGDFINNVSTRGFELNRIDSVYSRNVGGLLKGSIKARIFNGIIDGINDAIDQGRTQKAYSQYAKANSEIRYKFDGLIFAAMAAGVVSIANRITDTILCFFEENGVIFEKYRNDSPYIDTYELLENFTNNNLSNDVKKDMFIQSITENPFQWLTYVLGLETIRFSEEEIINIVNLVSFMRITKDVFAPLYIGKKPVYRFFEENADIHKIYQDIYQFIEFKDNLDMVIRDIKLCGELTADDFYMGEADFDPCENFTTKNNESVSWRVYSSVDTEDAAFSTYRGIRLGDSLELVLKAYKDCGIKEQSIRNEETCNLDETLSTLIEITRYDDEGMMKSIRISEKVIWYSFQECSIVFYFDQDDILIMIGFLYDPGRIIEKYRRMMKNTIALISSKSENLDILRILANENFTDLLKVTDFDGKNRNSYFLHMINSKIISKFSLLEYIPLAIFASKIKVFFYETDMILEVENQDIVYYSILYSSITELYFFMDTLVLILTTNEKILRITKNDCLEIQELFKLLLAILNISQETCSENLFQSRHKDYYETIISEIKKPDEIIAKIEQAKSLADRFSIAYYEKPDKHHFVTMVSDEKKVLYSDNKSRTNNDKKVLYARLRGCISDEPNFVWIYTNGRVETEGKEENSIVSSWKNIRKTDSHANFCIASTKVIRHTGISVNIDFSIYDISDIFGDYVVLKNGSVAYLAKSFDRKNYYAVTSSWQDIAMVSYGEYHIVGLKKDGTVVAAGRNNQGQCDISDWKDIISITVQDEITIGVKYDGTIVWSGSPILHILSDKSDFNIDISKTISSWQNIVAVTSGPGLIVGVKDNGQVVCTEAIGQANIENWRLGVDNIENDSVSDKATYENDNVIQSKPEKKETNIEDEKQKDIRDNESDDQTEINNLKQSIFMSYHNRNEKYIDPYIILENRLLLFVLTENSRIEQKEINHDTSFLINRGECIFVWSDYIVITDQAIYIFDTKLFVFEIRDLLEVLPCNIINNALDLSKNNWEGSCFVVRQTNGKNIFFNLKSQNEQTMFAFMVLLRFLEMRKNFSVYKPEINVLTENDTMFFCASTQTKFSQDRIKKKGFFSKEKLCPHCGEILDGANTHLITTNLNVCIDYEKVFEIEKSVRLALDHEIGGVIGAYKSEYDKRVIIENPEFEIPCSLDFYWGGKLHYNKSRYHTIILELSNGICTVYDNRYNEDDTSATGLMIDRQKSTSYTVSYTLPMDGIILINNEKYFYKFVPNNRYFESINDDGYYLEFDKPFLGFSTRWNYHEKSKVLLKMGLWNNKEL